MRKDQGFTLLEVLVATSLTLVVLMLSVQAFIGALRANEAVDLMSGTNENLQVAGTMITDDLVKAGQGMPVGGTVIPNGAGATAVLRNTPGALVLAAPTLYAITPGNEQGPQIAAPPPATPANTDLITVVYVDGTIPPMPLSVINADASQVTVLYDPANPVPELRGVQINSTPANTFVRGDLVLLRNSNGAVLQEVTSDKDPGSPQVLKFDGTTDQLNFNQPNAAKGNYKLLQTAGVFPATTAYRVNLVSYYIDSSTPALPLLMRRVSARPAVAVAQGIENIQFMFSMFKGGAIFDEKPAPTGTETPNEIRKVQVYLGGRSDQPSTQTKDYVRNSLLTQCNIRNLSFKDIYPGS
jgi:prepilin-type N-terminal cleavage/methylation domain-containing protein